MPRPEIGAVMEDGIVYAGVSPETGNGLFVMPTDAPLLMNISVIKGRIESINKDQILGHEDWRLPTFKELKVIFENKEKGALKGTFNETAERNKPFEPARGRTSPGWYRASDPGNGHTTKGIFFSDGKAEEMLTIESSSVRYVRDGETPGVVPPADVTVRQDSLKKLARAHRPVIKS